MRIALLLLGILGVIFASPWLPLLCIILLSLRYRAWEALVIGLLADLTWLPPDAGFHALPLFTLAALVIVWGLEPIRSEFLVP
jgi:hypothetical protein